MSSDRTRSLPLWALFVAIAAWFGLWFLTPGLLENGIGNLFTDDMAFSVLVETAVATAIALVLVLAHRRYNRVLFACSRSVWLYVLPAALAIALPFHYELILPVLLYIVWVTVSVFWQDYLTFGLLQCYLGERLPGWAVLIVSAVIFWLGHVLLLPDRFAPPHWLPSLAILALGFILAGLREWLKSLHVILALHLSFYFIFA